MIAWFDRLPDWAVTIGSLILIAGLCIGIAFLSVALVGGLAIINPWILAGGYFLGALLAFAVFGGFG